MTAAPRSLKTNNESCDLGSLSHAALITDAHISEVRPSRRHKSGDVSDIYEVTLKDGSTRLFKPVKSPWYSAMGGKIGISPRNALVPHRNLATVEYAKALGFDVIVNTGVAALKLDQRPESFVDDESLLVDWDSKSPVVGLLMDEARGSSGANLRADALQEGEVVRELTKLQWVDHLVGQVDRHRNNYFVDRENGAVKVTGIDNDACFGRKTKSAQDIKTQGKGTLLPPVIDRQMKEAIERLDEATVRPALKGFSEEEVSAAIGRLNDVKAHVATLPVIEPTPEQWAAAFREQLGSDNSYAKRDHEFKLAGTQQAAPAPSHPSDDM